MYSTNSMIAGPAHLSLIGLLLIMTGCGGGGDASLPQPAAPPAGFKYQAPPDINDLWSVSDAGTLGVSVELIEDMMDAIQQGEYPIIDSIAVAHQGQLILHETIRSELNEFDEWVDNTDLDMHVMFSISKSIASITMGINIDQGNIDSLDTPYLSLFPYQNYENWDPRKDQITLHHALAMQLGLEWNEWDPPYSDPGNQMFAFYDTHVDFSKGVLDLPMAADPGTQFAYNTPATVSLGQAIENTAPLALVDFGSTYLLSPLGISRVKFFDTPTGLPDLGRGLYFTTRDLLKFGQLYLDGGEWNGQRIVSETWVTASIQPYTAISWPNPETKDWQLSGYGYQWWIGYFEFQGRELPTFAASGHGEQWLMVIPALELVVAVNSHAWQERDDQTNQVFNLIKRFLLPAIQQ